VLLLEDLLEGAGDARMAVEQITPVLDERVVS
jgi:hypothetical protein